MRTRAIQWLLGMQSSDGGWAAFDVDNNWQLLNKVPFADHNAMLDPTCPDITGRVIEALPAGHRRKIIRPFPRRELSAHPRKGRELVWPVGSELYLWNFSGVTGLAAAAP